MGQSIFKLEAPDFAWQFLLTLRKNGRQKTKWPPKIKLSITQSIFKLEAPYFVLTLRKNGCQKTKWPPKKTKWPPKIKLSIVNFQARSSRFCMVVHIDPPQQNLNKKNGRQKLN